MKDTTSLSFLFFLCFVLLLNHGIARQISNNDVHKIANEKQQSENVMVNHIDPQAWFQQWNSMLEKYTELNQHVLNKGGSHPNGFFPFPFPYFGTFPGHGSAHPPLPSGFQLPPWWQHGDAPPKPPGFQLPPWWQHGGAHPPLPGFKFPPLPPGFQLPPWWQHGDAPPKPPSSQLPPWWQHGGAHPPLPGLKFPPLPPGFQIPPWLAPLLPHPPSTPSTPSGGGNSPPSSPTPPGLKA